MKPVDPQQLIRDVGRRVAELRVERGQTQEQLAARAEVAARYIQTIEAGTENLTLETLAKLANLFQVEVISFFESPVTEKPRPGRPKKS